MEQQIFLAGEESTYQLLILQLGSGFTYQLLILQKKKEDLLFRTWVLLFFKEDLLTYFRPVNFSCFSLISRG